MSVVLKRVTLLFVFVLSSLLSQQAAARSLPDFTELAADNGAAVVNISTKQKVKRTQRLPKGFEMPEIPEGSPFEDFSGKKERVLRILITSHWVPVLLSMKMVTWLLIIM